MLAAGEDRVGVRFASGRLHRPRGLVSCVAREYSLHDPRILVGKRNGRDVGVPPLPHFAEPEASRILLAGQPGLKRRECHESSVYAVTDRHVC